MFPVAATDAADTDPDVDIEPPVIAPAAVTDVTNIFVDKPIVR